MGRAGERRDRATEPAEDIEAERLRKMTGAVRTLLEVSHSVTRTRGRGGGERLGFGCVCDIRLQA